MKYYFFYFLIVILFSSCKTEKEPKLTKLTYDEMRELMFSNSIKVNDSVLYYSINGELLNDNQRKAASEDLLYADWFINDDMQLIKVQLNDSALERKNRKKTPLVTDAEMINCQELNELLEEVYDRDQQNRTDNLMDQEIDQNNLEVVDLVLDKCGMPSSQMVSDKSLQAIWLVIQHAGAEKREQYFPTLEKAAQNGDLDQQDIALMKDRMMLDKGQPQIYGSQVMMNGATYELYDLENPEKVDQRRATVGLGPLSEYLAHWDIEFTIPQKPTD